MRINFKFIKISNNAVSYVINIILMIAITTAAVGIVYYYLATNPTQEVNRPEAMVKWDVD